MSGADSWVGEKARVTPSGHVHLVEWVEFSNTFDRDNVFLACGKEARRSWMSLHFPPAARHCSRCFTGTTS